MTRLTLALFFSALFSFYSLAGCKTDAYGVKHCGAGNCKLDSQGYVHCSKFPKGGAAVNSEGIVMCGVGKCVRDDTGFVYCGKKLSLTVRVNVLGQASCENGCELGKPENCEANPVVVEPPNIEQTDKEQAELKKKAEANQALLQQQAKR